MNSHPPTRLHYGGDYNPEQWNENVWPEDMRLMREAGVNLVSLGIFSWAKLEPSPGNFDFAWLDRIMDLLAESGISVDLATPTASPPPWLAERYPKTLPMDAEGQILWPGSRQHYCPNSADYSRHARQIATAVAHRYGGHQALLAWHINNEYGCHLHACYCDNCAEAFRVWLQARYKDLDTLNKAWGTAFWSQWYGEWREINPPRKAPTFVNPTQQLDYKRFMNHSLLRLMLAEKEIVKQVTPDIPVTTNFMGFFEPLDYFEWGKHLDFTSWDSYPDPNGGLGEVSHNALGHDLTRSCGGGKPFVLMEQVTSQVNWRDVNSLRRPGIMRLMSWQAVARGSDGVLFFQWRQSVAGAEKYHGAMLQHAGEKGRVFQEVKALGAELSAAAGLAGSRVRARAAIAIDWQSRWAVEQGSKPARINFHAILLWYHRAFYEANIMVDLTTPESDWSGYDLVIAPSLYMLTDAGVDNVRNFVDRGGTFLATWFSGIVDENEHVRPGGYPAGLRAVLGLHVEEWDPRPEGSNNAMQFADGASVSCGTWCEVLHTEGAETLATYAEDFYAGKPALTCNKFGKGRAYYLSTQPEQEWLNSFVLRLCEEQEIHAVIDTPRGVEATLREKDGRRFLFLLNHANGPVQVDLKGRKARDLMNGMVLPDRLELPKAGVSVLELL